MVIRTYNMAKPGADFQRLRFVSCTAMVRRLFRRPRYVPLHARKSRWTYGKTITLVAAVIAAYLVWHVTLGPSAATFWELF